MHIQFAGDFCASKTREEVYTFLTDPRRFCPVLPDYKSMEIEDDSHFIVTLSIGISHIRGNAKIRMELAEAEFPARAVYLGKGDVPGGSTILTAGFDLEEQSGGTKLLWKGESQIVGRLASLGGGLLEPLARKNLNKLIEGLQAALSDETKQGSPGEKKPLAGREQLAGGSA
jgi:carbon monoxide dehydrogenase subunit G